MTNSTPPTHQHFSCWQDDDTPRPIDGQFEASEMLFRGFTSVDLEETGGVMPGICFRFDPHCSVNRGKFCDWKSIANDEVRPHMGVLGVTVETVSISSESEGVAYGTRLLHTPNETTNNYAYTDIQVPVPAEDFSKNGRRKAAKHWRTKLDERINDSEPERWKALRLRDAKPKEQDHS